MNVYEPKWKEYGEENYSDFTNMLFCDIKKNDRISRYYNIIV